MTQREGTRSISIVTACMLANGLPTFGLNHVEVTGEELENGIHYYLAEAELLQEGFEEPLLHFPEGDAPAFLFPAVQEQLPACPQSINHLSEETCPASSK